MLRAASLATRWLGKWCPAPARVARIADSACSDGVALHDRYDPGTGGRLVKRHRSGRRQGSAPRLPGIIERKDQSAHRGQPSSGARPTTKNLYQVAARSLAASARHISASFCPRDRIGAPHFEDTGEDADITKTDRVQKIARRCCQ
jgi:hypothetical protein